MLSQSFRDLEQHLDRDVELATELAVRYGDAVHRRRAGYEGHGGLIEGGALRDRCIATLLSAIAKTHNVSLDRIVAVRTRGRRPIGWDVMVILVFALIYSAVSWRIARSLLQRFPRDEGWVSFAAPVIVSICIGFAGVALFELWATTFEMVRVGNGHLSGYRASWNPWDDHFATLYMAGVFLFLVVAGVQYRLKVRRLSLSP